MIITKKQLAEIIHKTIIQTSKACGSNFSIRQLNEIKLKIQKNLGVKVEG